MNKKSNNRTENISMIRLTVEEKNTIMNDYRQSGYNNLTRFIRDKLLIKKTLKNPEKIFLAYNEMGKMRTEFNRMGNNINQIAYRMNALKSDKFQGNDVQMIRELLDAHREVIAKFDEL